MCTKILSFPFNSIFQFFLNVLFCLSQLHDTISRLSSKEVNPAVQESKEFKHKIKELEKKIRDMTNVIEEFPRDVEHNLLFHGIPVADKENFYSKAKVVSEIIRSDVIL